MNSHNVVKSIHAGDFITVTAKEKEIHKRLSALFWSFSHSSGKRPITLHNTSQINACFKTCLLTARLADLAVSQSKRFLRAREVSLSKGCFTLQWVQKAPQSESSAKTQAVGALPASPCSARHSAPCYARGGTSVPKDYPTAGASGQKPAIVSREHTRACRCLGVCRLCCSSPPKHHGGSPTGSKLSPQMLTSPSRNPSEMERGLDI